MSTKNVVNTTLSGSSGSGSFAGSTSPTFVTPSLDASTATSITFGGSVLNLYTAPTSWTPTFTCATPGNLSVSYSTQSGSYIKIGKLVFLSFNLVCTPTFTTASGNILTGSLPFPVSFTQGGLLVSNISTGFTWPTGDTALTWQTSSGSSTLFLVAIGSAHAANGLAMTAISTGVQISISGSGVYYTTS